MYLTLQKRPLSSSFFQQVSAAISLIQSKSKAITDPFRNIIERKSIVEHWVIFFVLGYSLIQYGFCFLPFISDAKVRHLFGKFANGTSYDVSLFSFAKIDQDKSDIFKLFLENGGRKNATRPTETKK